jgi:predicted glycoside hydrolase/deacetylase ChbG (UPF0249 family)
MAIRLICNADDFGSSQKATDDIIYCHNNGIISSTTLMANMPATKYACTLSQSFKSLGVGIHLVLTAGKSITKRSSLPDLVDSDGYFLPYSYTKKLFYKTNKEVLHQVETEFASQVEVLLENGLKPTHFDTHHGIHSMPLIRDAIINISNKYNIKLIRNQVCKKQCFDKSDYKNVLNCFCANIRQTPKRLFRKHNNYLLLKAGFKMPDLKVSPRLIVGKANLKDKMIFSLNNMKKGTYEMVFHPENCDKSDITDRTINRLEDYELVLDEDVKRMIEDKLIKLISYRDVI